MLLCGFVASPGMFRNIQNFVLAVFGHKTQVDIACESGTVGKDLYD